MGVENRFGQAPGLEQRETEEQSIGSYLKDAGMDVLGKNDALYQHGVDGHTDHHEKALKTQGCQVA